jgi:inositol transport system permease protein
VTTEPAPTLARPIEASAGARRRLPPELSILGVMIGMMLLFEALGWIFVGQSFIANPLRLKIMILQEAVIGIIAVGVTQVIIMGGIDLSSGSLVGMTAMIAASLAQSAGFSHAIYPSLTGLNPFFPVAAGLICGGLAGLINGGLIALTKIPPFIATLGMMVSARGVADWYTDGQPIGNLEDSYAMIGTGWWPVVIFLVVAAIFHIALRYTRYGKFTYAIGGLLSGLAGIVQTARAISGQAGVGVGFELDAIAAAVIGGTSLSGGVGRLTGTVIGTVILGVLTSGFTFLNVDAHYQEIIKGAVIIAAVVADQYRQRRRRGA